MCLLLPTHRLTESVWQWKINAQRHRTIWKIKYFLPVCCECTTTDSDDASNLHFTQYFSSFFLSRVHTIYFFIIFWVFSCSSWTNKICVFCIYFNTHHFGDIWHFCNEERNSGQENFLIYKKILLFSLQLHTSQLLPWMQSHSE